MNELLIFGIIFVSLVLILGPIAIASKRLRDREALGLATETGGYDLPSVSHQASAASTPKPAPRRLTPPPVVAPVTPATIPPTPEALAAQVSAPPPSMSLERTLRVLTDSLHLMLVGESNAGKSTAAEAVLAARVAAGDQVLILDPHADPTIWRGLPAVGTGRDYVAIADAMDRLVLEMSDRYQRKAAGDISYPPVSLFIDEWPAIQLHCKNAGAFMAQMAQEARKVGMRLVVLTQSDRVESLGLSGKGDVRENFTMLLLGNKATAALPETARMSRPGAVRRGARLVPATVDGLDQIGRATPLGPAVLYAVPSAGLPTAAPSESSVGFDLDAELVRAAQVAAAEVELGLAPVTSTPASTVSENMPDLTPKNDNVIAVLPDTYQVKPSNAILPQDELSKMIRLLVTGGISRNKIVENLRIPGQRNDQLRRIKVALGEVVEESNEKAKAA